MSKQVITVEGEEKVVREDVAKKYRGINWAILSIAAIIIIAAILLLTGVIRLAADPDPAPAPTESLPAQ